MPIITQPTTPQQSFVVKLITSTGRNHIQKQSGTYSALYLTPGSRTEEKTIELLPNGVYESNMSESYSNLVVFTDTKLGLNVTFDGGVSAELSVSKLLALDTKVLHFTLINNSVNVARIKLNTVSVSMDLPLGLLYYGVALHPLAFTEAFVKGLPAEAGAKDRTIQVNAGANQKIFYCYPQVYGDSQFTVSGFVGGFSLAAQVPVLTPNGTVVYNVYESDNTGLGVTNVTISS